ncbi:ribosome small subunit-dependent GTPase A [Oceanivirga salmonicida]|uniref:ribosome small subunit-dependent GTPase A n=1 Tax=Oceanivirga salmonicida TaxID=1769291 RepID=UPI0012E27C45|nr:ribosome small subunit-dependent GTPase A [Oceanivirga salmonicida]
MNQINYRVIGKTQGFYEVIDNLGNIYTTKLKGTLKRENSKLNCVIGDKVEISIQDMLITNVLERKNLLLRPLVSNIDYVAIMTSIINPTFDINAFQKKLLWVDKQKIKTILIINKIDLVNDIERKDFIENLKSKIKHIKIFEISVEKNIGITELKEFLKEKIIVLSGASGVGKSSLVNNILENETLEVGNISRKTKKGKNTTIITKYFEKNGIKIFDTPGYSSIALPEYDEIREIMTWIPDFENYLYQCKFKDCLHLIEPDCNIIKEVEKGNINKYRYEFYKKLIEGENNNERN